MNQVEIKIAGMHCEGCVSGIKRALDAVPGVQSVVVELAAQRALVAGAADHAALRGAVEDAGFDVVGEIGLAA
jgi:copper chaperone CopZ